MRVALVLMLLLTSPQTPDIHFVPTSNTITDAMLKLAETQSFFGYRFDGRIFDCGSKIGFLTANVAYALARPDIAPAFRAELTHLLGGQ